MANRKTRRIILALALCLLAWASPMREGAARQSPSESVIRKAIIRELGDPREVSGDDKINFVSARADLNNDGHAEVLVWVPTINYGGTSGYPLLIFRHEGRRLRLIGKFEQVWTPLIISRASRHGWRDVVMQMGGGGMPMEYVVFRYDGRRYPDDPREIAAARVRGRQLIGQDWQMTLVGPLPAKR